MRNHLTDLASFLFLLWQLPGPALPGNCHKHSGEKGEQVEKHSDRGSYWLQPPRTDLGPRRPSAPGAALGDRGSRGRGARRGLRRPRRRAGGLRREQSARRGGGCGDLRHPGLGAYGVPSGLFRPNHLPRLPGPALPAPRSDRLRVKKLTVRSPYSCGRGVSPRQARAGSRAGPWPFPQRTSWESGLGGLAL